MSIRGINSVFIVGAMVLILAGLSEARAASNLTLTGRVESDGTGLPGYEVSLLVKFAGPSGMAKTLGTATTDTFGDFEIAYRLPRGLFNRQQPILLVIAEDLSSMLASAIGVAPVLNDVVVNERTTVATGFAFAQFIDGTSLDGNEYGLINAVHMAGNMANPETGAVGDVLGSPPNGPDTSTLATFNSLANIVASCVESEIGCGDLFDATPPPGGPPPGNVLQAVANIAKFPWLNPVTLFSLSTVQKIYSPALTSAPDAWALFLRFTGTDSSEQTSDDLMNGPGAFAIDEKGFLWVNDNYIPQPPEEVACAGLRLLKFYPWGESFPGSPFFGGGLEGVGFGITIAPNGHIWVGNFGFEAPECAVPENPFGTPATSDSVSEFLPSGVPVSPDVTGYLDGNIFFPQATVADRRGNIWMANCGNDSVTVYPKGMPRKAFNVSNIGVVKPFGLAIDGEGRAWVTGNRSDSVAVIGPKGDLWAVIDGTGTPTELTHPMGIAADSQGNMWVSNSDLVDIPCPPPIQDLGDAENPSIALLTPDGQFHENSPFTGGGLTIPWGIAVDGNDTVWVANFGIDPGIDDPDGIEPSDFVPRVSQFCGVDVSKCPPSKQVTGQPISPDAGYASNALLRNTGVSIDPSGNVWLANNWKEIPPQINPGGNSIAVMIGAAAPLKTPLIGLPRSFD